MVSRGWLSTTTLTSSSTRIGEEYDEYCTADFINSGGEHCAHGRDDQTIVLNKNDLINSGGEHCAHGRDDQNADWNKNDLFNSGGEHYVHGCNDQTVDLAKDDFNNSGPDRFVHGCDDQAIDSVQNEFINSEGDRSVRGCDDQTIDLAQKEFINSEGDRFVHGCNKQTIDSAQNEFINSGGDRFVHGCDEQTVHLTQNDFINSGADRFVHGCDEQITAFDENDLINSEREFDSEDNHQDRKCGLVEDDVGFKKYEPIIPSQTSSRRFDFEEKNMKFDSSTSCCADFDKTERFAEKKKEELAIDLFTLQIHCPYREGQAEAGIGNEIIMGDIASTDDYTYTSVDSRSTGDLGEFETLGRGVCGCDHHDYFFRCHSAPCQQKGGGFSFWTKDSFISDFESQSVTDLKKNKCASVLRCSRCRRCRSPSPTCRRTPPSCRRTPPSPHPCPPWTWRPCGMASQRVNMLQARGGGGMASSQGGK